MVLALYELVNGGYVSLLIYLAVTKPPFFLGVASRADSEMPKPYFVVTLVREGFSLAASPGKGIFRN